MFFLTLGHPFSNHHAAIANFLLPSLFVLLVCPGISQLSLKKTEAEEPLQNVHRNRNVYCGPCYVHTAEERWLLR